MARTLRTPQAEPTLYYFAAVRRRGALGPSMGTRSLEAAEDYCAYLVRECGYDPATASVEVSGGCGNCDGNGRLPKHRGRKVVPFAWVPCEHCEGQGHVVVAVYNPLQVSS